MEKMIAHRDGLMFALLEDKSLEDGNDLSLGVKKGQGVQLVIRQDDVVLSSLIEDTPFGTSTVLVFPFSLLHFWETVAAHQSVVDTEVLRRHVAEVYKETL